MPGIALESNLPMIITDSTPMLDDLALANANTAINNANFVPCEAAYLHPAKIAGVQELAPQAPIFVHNNYNMGIVPAEQHEIGETQDENDDDPIFHPGDSNNDESLKLNKQDSSDDEDYEDGDDHQSDDDD